MHKQAITRYTPNHQYGLTQAQVQSRIDDGLLNYDTSISTKTIPRILRDNFFTLFNLINFVLAFAIFYVGSYKNLLFMGVVISNIIISSYQEIRAKKTVDKLSIVSSSKTKALRGGEKKLIEIPQLVLDDILCFTQGNQIPTDSIVVDGQCDVNESLLTGESDSIHKVPGDTLLSGSYIVSGSCKARVENIGTGNYASKISQDAKYVKKVNSQIMAAFNRVILIISLIIIPVGVLLFYGQLQLKSFEMSVVNTAAALIGMIPEGLVLLTSTVLAVSVIKLARHKVLVQELYCIETLARVDVLCLDKTGTITEGIMEVADVIPFGGHSRELVIDGLSILAHTLKDDNPTFNAIKQLCQDKSCICMHDVRESIPFSSEKKWSGVSINGKGCYIMGACELILSNEKQEKIIDEIRKYATKNRVVLVVHSMSGFINGAIPDDVDILGMVLIKDKIRPNAHETLSFFGQQGVDIKIISGDSPITVSNIAKSAGLKNAENYVDLSEITDEQEVKRCAEKYTVFGRVSPYQKKQLICALKQKGHTVAMTGDGVNDVLALKEADCSIAMASGSDAARTVSQLVLLNSDFSAMPHVVHEGRRSINNIQRSSSLFLVKTIYATILAIIFLFITNPYPFMPIQMTLVSTFTIGIPSFILALEPNNERITGNFFINTMGKAIPGGITIVFSILSVMAIGEYFHITHDQISTLCVIITSFCGFMILYDISYPLNLIRKILFTTMLCGLICGMVLFRKMLSLVEIDTKLLFMMCAIIALSYAIFNVSVRLTHNMIKYYGICTYFLK